MVISKSDVEDVDAGLVRAVVDGVLAVVHLIAVDVGAMRTLDGDAQTAIACITVSHNYHSVYDNTKSNTSVKHSK